MARVPYSPVPEVAPQAQQLSKPNLAVPAAAFGSAEAEALGAVGTAIGRAGDKIFGRAMALQELNNQTESREAATKFMVGAGELHANYMTLEGKARVDAYPGYVKQLQELRQKVGGGLSNPASRRLYEGTTYSTLGHSLFNAAGAAASANRKWTNDTVKAQLNLDIQSLGDDPTNEVFFQQKLDRIRGSARNIAAQDGAPPGSAIERNTVMRAESQAWRSRITGMARTQPFEAAKLLDKNKSKFTETDYLAADQVVRTQGRAVGASNIANEVYDPSATLEQMEAAARAKAKDLNPNDPLLDDQAVNALRTKYNQSRWATKQEALTARDDSAALIEKNNPANMQQFLALPGGQETYERLSAKDKEALPGRITRYNSAVGKYDQERTFTRLKGMAASDDPEAREQFLTLDPTSQNLSQPQMRSVMELQRKLKENVSGDPRVTKAVTWLRGAMGPQLQELGIYNRKDSPETFDNYVGALQSALDYWQEVHKKPPTYKEIVETIGPQVIREVAVPGRFFGTNEYPLFDFPTYTPEYQTFETQAKAQFGDISDTAIRKMWVKYQYIKLYGKQPKAQERVK